MRLGPAVTVLVGGYDPSLGREAYMEMNTNLHRARRRWNYLSRILGARYRPYVRQFAL